jgi:Holliday junction resolvasome RuvABC endonuclease subunit
MGSTETTPSSKRSARSSKKSAKQLQAELQYQRVLAGMTSSPALALSLKQHGNVMGLDLSLRGAGVAVSTSNGRRLALETLGETFKKKQIVTEEMKLQRMLQIARGVVRLAREHSVSVVAMEDYAFNRFQGSSSVTALAELGGIVRSQMLLTLGITVLKVPRSQALKEVLGWGKLEKEEVVKFWERSEALEGVTLRAKTTDEAEALTVAHWLCMKVSRS